MAGYEGQKFLDRLARSGGIISSLGMENASSVRMINEALVNSDVWQVPVAFKKMCRKPTARCGTQYKYPRTGNFVSWVRLCVSS